MPAPLLMVRNDEFEDDDVTAPCPHCGVSIYDDAEQCPNCGCYLSREDAPVDRKPLWVLIGVAICVLIVLAWVVGRL